MRSPIETDELSAPGTEAAESTTPVEPGGKAWERLRLFDDARGLPTVDTTSAGNGNGAPAAEIPAARLRARRRGVIGPG